MNRKVSVFEVDLGNGEGQSVISITGNFGLIVVFFFDVKISDIVCISQDVEMGELKNKGIRGIRKVVNLDISCEDY